MTSKEMGGIMDIKELGRLAYRLRKDAVDIIMSGNGGHIGGDMSVMEILVTLYFDQMDISPEQADDPDRDMFVMSKGHSVEAYYSVLAEKGFMDIREVIEQFGKFGSRYIGHPNNKLPGIEMNSGSLGHGLPVCVPTQTGLCWDGAGIKAGCPEEPCIYRHGRRRTGRGFRMGSGDGRGPL